MKASMMDLLLVNGIFIIFFASAAATFFGNVIPKHREWSSWKPQYHSSDHDFVEDYRPTRRSTYTSTESLWRTPSVTSESPFTDRYPVHSMLAEKKKHGNILEEDSARSTTERWRTFDLRTSSGEDSVEDYRRPAKTRSHYTPDTFRRTSPSNSDSPFAERYPSQDLLENKGYNEGTARTATALWRTFELGSTSERAQPRITKKRAMPSQDLSSPKYSGGKDTNGRGSSEGVDGTQLRLADKWCGRYQKMCNSRSSENGLVSKIIGGVPAKPKSHPYMVMVGYGASDERQWLCGGSLISSRYVLSAAHCSQLYRQGPARWARLGELDTSTSQEDARPEEREIVERKVHHGYREPAVYHDIALFKLDREVGFSLWVSPVCLQVGRGAANSLATVAGWGRTDFVSETSSALLEVDVRLFDVHYCNSTINKNAGVKMPGGYDATTMVCAGDRAGGKDACQGDSGGPLIVGDGCAKRQVGITSIGSDCGLPDSPGVYTKVSEYVAWIEGIVWR